MGKASKKKNTRPPRLKKRKVGITVRSKAKIKPKGSQRVKSDSLSPTPTPREQGATLKLRIKRR